MAEKQELIDALAGADCIDTDVWKLARPDVSAAAAVFDLRARYPAAFSQPKPVFDARKATRAECDAWIRNHNQSVAREQQKQRDAAELARIEAKYGAKT